ncbi:LysR substrate-binding domain-containing protein [Pseudosulfitobacter sp. RP-4]
MNIPKRASYMPSTNELIAFVSCAELGSTAAAGQELNLTQSAISRAIASLEQRLAVRLFDRIRQRLVLTDAGRAMLREAKDVLVRLDNSARMAMAFGGADSVLRLAVLPSFAKHWLIPRLPRFVQDHPQIRLDVAPELAPVDFADSHYDAALQRAEFAGPNTHVMPLYPEKLIVVANPSLSTDQWSDPAQLLEYQLIQQSTRPQLWSDWLRAADLDPFMQLRGPRFAHFDMVVGAAEAGLGLALLPEVLAANGLASGTLVRASSVVVETISPYALIWPAHHKDEGAVNVFARWLKGVIENTAVP